MDCGLWDSIGPGWLAVVGGVIVIMSRHDARRSRRRPPPRLLLNLGRRALTDRRTQVIIGHDDGESEAREGGRRIEMELDTQRAGGARRREATGQAEVEESHALFVCVRKFPTPARRLGPRDFSARLVCASIRLLSPSSRLQQQLLQSQLLLQTVAPTSRL